MDFLVDFLWYLLAFALGALVAYLVAMLLVRPTSPDEAFEDLPGSREIGDRR